MPAAKANPQNLPQIAKAPGKRKVRTSAAKKAGMSFSARRVRSRTLSMA